MRIRKIIPNSAKSCLILNYQTGNKLRKQPLPLRIGQSPLYYTSYYTSYYSKKCLLTHRLRVRCKPYQQVGTHLFINYRHVPPGRYSTAHSPKQGYFTASIGCQTVSDPYMRFTTFNISEDQKSFKAVHWALNLP